LCESVTVQKKKLGKTRPAWTAFIRNFTLPVHILLHTSSGWWISTRTSRAISNIHCQIWFIYYGLSE